MSASPQVRRATVEDLPKLVPLWQLESLPWQDFEKRFREFQVIEAADGELLGSVGLATAGHDACLHSEVYAHPEQSDGLRELLWQRLQSLSANHGLARLWTVNAAPFWHGIGFQLATTEQLTRLPAAFGEPTQAWRHLQLKDTSVEVSIEKEFAVFREVEKERTQKLMQRAKRLRTLAAVMGFVLLAFVLVWAFLFLRAQGWLPQR